MKNKEPQALRVGDSAQKFIECHHTHDDPQRAAAHARRLSCGSDTRGRDGPPPERAQRARVNSGERAAPPLLVARRAQQRAQASQRPARRTRARAAGAAARRCAPWRWRGGARRSATRRAAPGTTTWSTCSTMSPTLTVNQQKLEIGLVEPRWTSPLGGSI